MNNPSWLARLPPRWSLLLWTPLAVTAIVVSPSCQSPNPLPEGNGDEAPASESVVSSDPSVNSLGMKFVRVPGAAAEFGIWEVRRRDYDAFVRATGHPWPSVDKSYFRNAETPDHPAVNVSWTDAVAFCQWLSRKDGVPYRLPTDREWSIAAGIGSLEPTGRTPSQLDGVVAGVYPHPQGPKAGNYLDQTWFHAYQNYETSADRSRFFHSDGHVFTAPVGSLPADGNGIHDLGGNVWEWCADKYGRGQDRVLRGGSWEDGTDTAIFASTRWYRPPFHRDRQIGFRVVREVTD